MRKSGRIQQKPRITEKNQKNIREKLEKEKFLLYYFCMVGTMYSVSRFEF